jgi:hypothetical protein
LSSIFFLEPEGIDNAVDNFKTSILLDKCCFKEGIFCKRANADVSANGAELEIFESQMAKAGN